MNTNLIEYIIEKTELKQKDIAEKLGVSTAQVSKWKSGESIPVARQLELQFLCGAIDVDLDWIQLVGTKENAESWIAYLVHMTSLASEAGETNLLSDMPEVYGKYLLNNLSMIGVEIKGQAPAQPFYDEEIEDMTYTDFDRLIDAYLNNYTPLAQWCEHCLPYNEELADVTTGMHSTAVDLAVKYIDDELLEKNGVDLAKFRSFVQQTDLEARKDISELCSEMITFNIPFRRDYFEFINVHPLELEDSIMVDLIVGNSVDDFLSYGERKILQENQLTNKLLINLHEKLELSLPVEEDSDQRVRHFMDDILGDIILPAMVPKGPVDDNTTPF